MDTPTPNPAATPPPKNNRIALYRAIAAVQSELPRFVKSSTAQVPTKNGRGREYKYIELLDIWEQLKPILAKNGLIVINSLDGPILRTAVIHVESGEEVSCQFPVNTTLLPQQIGSAFTYARRYALCALLQIVADDDDDGGAAQRGFPTPPPF